MSKSTKNLGLHCDVFEQFITQNYIYVDKTEIIHQLITHPKQQHYYFVARPRRFGKTLFISTLKEIFSGRKELFTGYWIGQHSNYDWPTYSVISLNFSGIAHKTPEQLTKSLCRTLLRIAHTHNIVIAVIDDPEDILISLVEGLAAKNQTTDNRIVLLIDEYDKPLIDHIDNLPLAEENKKILISFYTTVKSLNAYWRAIFVTGVSSFSKTSLFSGLNNLRELTFDPTAAHLFGYTYEELITYFTPDIEALATHHNYSVEETLQKLRHWYNGYRFCTDTQKPLVYNPLSIVTCLLDKEFSNFWFKTGNPEFLITLLQKKGISLEMREPIRLSLNSLSSLDLASLPLYPLLVQTGYLTIADYDRASASCTLDFPNQEVREAFRDYLVQAFAYAAPEIADREILRMREAIINHNFTAFCDSIKVLIAGIPYNLHTPRESYYHSLFHLILDMLRMKPQSEVASSRGRADLVLETTNSMIVFEFKFDSSAHEALNQIKEKKYYEKYENDNNTINKHRPSKRDRGQHENHTQTIPTM